MRVTLLWLTLTACRTPTDKAPKTLPDEPRTDDSADPDDSAPPDDSAASLDADGDGSPADEDCDDTNPAVFPGAPETCDGVDQDCDGEADDGFSAPDCMAEAPACPLMPAPPAHPAPLVSLAFEGTDWSANAGSLTGGAWTVYAAVGETGEGAVGQGFEAQSLGWGATGNRYLQVGSNPALHPETFTIAAWVRPEDGDSSMAVANTMWDSGYRGFTFLVNYGQVTLGLGDGDSSAYVAVPIPIGAWSHVAATFDGEVVALYVNGELRLREHLPAGFSGYAPATIAYEGASSGSTFVVGAYQNPAYYAFTGGIDELRYYDAALVGAQIRREAQVGRWRFDGAAMGQDDGPRARDLTVSGALTCGPVGGAWTREGGEPAATLDEDRALELRAGLSVSLLARPDRLSGTAVLARREGAWSLSLDGGSLAWSITASTGAMTVLRADLSDRLGLWTDLQASFDGTRSALFVDGELRAWEVTGFDTLAAGSGSLTVGEGFDGGLDELELSALSHGLTAPAEPLLLGRWRAGEVSATGEGLVGEGRVGLDLSGSSEAAQDADALRTCLYLHEASREACLYRTGRLSAAADLGGPVTFRVVLRPDPAALTKPLAFFGVEGGPQLELSPTGYALVWGETRAEGGPAPTDRWTTLTGVVSAEGLRLYVDGTLAASTDFEAPFAPRARFGIGSGLFLATLSEGGAEALRLDTLDLHGEAWEDDSVTRRDAPWRAEGHPVLGSSAVSMGLLGDAAILAAADAALATLTSASGAPGTEAYPHFAKASEASALAMAATITTGAASEAYLDGALARLEDLDTGYWQWGWFQGRLLSGYAVAYDLVAPLLIAKEATDPWEWAPRHAAIRRNLLALAHQAYEVGGLDEDGYYSYGFNHSGTSWTSANARLMTSGGLAQIGLVLGEERDPVLSGGEALRRLVTDDLLEPRPGEGEAQGRYLEMFLPASGLFCEGTGYQNDVFYTLTPALYDLAAAGEADLLNEGRVGAMYDADVAGMMPSGHTMTYATGWMDGINSVALASELVADSDRAARWDWLALRQGDPDTTATPPAFTSAVMGQDAAVLRSGWGAEDRYMMLFGKTEACNSGHAQDDAASLSMMSHGAWLLIDPGDGRSYGGTPDAALEAWLQSAAGHNNVLVDGQGPEFNPGYETPPDPAWVGASLLSQRADYVHMLTTVGGSAAAGGTDHDRRVWLVDDAFYVLADHLSSGVTRTFAQQHHLGGSFTSGYGALSTTDDGFVWDTLNPIGEAVSLHVFSLPGAQRVTSFVATDGGTNVSYPQVWDHTYVRLTVEGQNEHLFSLLVPQGPDEAAPAVESLLSSEALRAVAVETDATGRVVLMLNTSGSADGPEALVSDGLLSGTDGASWAFVSDGYEIRAEGGLEAAATCTLDALSLSLDGASLDGVVAREVGDCALTVAWEGSPGAVEVDGVASGDWTWTEGRLTLDPAPVASFRVE